MRKYQALLFDLFGTVAIITRENLPLFEWEGVTSHATTGELRAVFETDVKDVPSSSFVAALLQVAREHQETSARDLREVSCVRRFTRTLLRAGLPETASTFTLAVKLARRHQSLLMSVTEIPPDHTRFLKEIRERYPLALVSNFDDGETAREVLRKGAALDHFDHVVISEENGWKKPSPNIFEEALTVLGVDARNALFIGDSPEDDIRGAKAIGMDVAWINPTDRTLPSGIPEPDFTIPSIPDLRRFL